jgi:hypothetical protein
MPDFTFRLGKANADGRTFEVVIHSTMWVTATVTGAVEKAERAAMEPRNPMADLATLTSSDGLVVWSKHLM